jgi:hypothetical protein
MKVTHVALRKVTIMPQQEMRYDDMDHERSGFAGGAYEGTPFSSFQGEKLSRQAGGLAPTPGQRLALAVVSLSILMVVTFVGIGAAAASPPWGGPPILFILVLFSVATVIINIVFNRKA